MVSCAKIISFANFAVKSIFLFLPTMKKKLLTAIFVSSLCGSMQAQDAPHGYPYSPVPFTSVKMTDSFGDNA